jgi:hypothetical protein
MIMGRISLEFIAPVPARFEQRSDPLVALFVPNTEVPELLALTI